MLSDRLLEIGMNTNLTNAEIVISVNEMAKECFNAIGKNNNQTIREMSIDFRRVDNAWRWTAGKLEEQGMGFIKPEGFTILCKSKKEFEFLFK